MIISQSTDSYDNWSQNQMFCFIIYKTLDTRPNWIGKGTLPMFNSRTTRCYTNFHLELIK